MNRREFLRSSGTLALGAVLNSCYPRERRESRLLTEFLESEKVTDRRDIERILYDINEIDRQGKKSIKGRATHLGDNFFLTAYHVVDKGNLELVPQTRRGNVWDSSQEFEVVEYDEDSNLALLKTDKKYKGKPSLHLSYKIPLLGDDVSTFIRLIGDPHHVDYEYELRGRDFYDNSKEILLGKLVIPANSLVYEKQGKVLERIPNDIEGKENQLFSSIASSEDESGQHVFLRKGDNYFFAGILTGFYKLDNELDNKIEINYHHFGEEFLNLKQTGSFFAHREPIERLIRRYVKRMSR